RSSSQSDRTPCFHGKMASAAAAPPIPGRLRKSTAMQPGGHETVPAELRFATYLAPRMMPVYQVVADAVGSALGCRTVLVAEPSHENWAKDEYDVSFVCGLPYVDFERRGSAPAIPVAAPVLAGDRYGGAAPFFFFWVCGRGAVVGGCVCVCGRPPPYPPHPP